MHLPLWLTKNLFAKSGTERFRENIYDGNVFVFKKFLDLQVKNIDNLIFFR